MRFIEWWKGYGIKQTVYTRKGLARLAWEDAIKSHNKGYAAALRVFNEFIDQASEQDLFGVWLEERLNSED